MSSTEKCLSVWVLMLRPATIRFGAMMSLASRCPNAANIEARRFSSTLRVKETAGAVAGDHDGYDSRRWTGTSELALRTWTGWRVALVSVKPEILIACPSRSKRQLS
jgi:hypothetical protein